MRFRIPFCLFAVLTLGVGCPTPTPVGNDGGPNASDSGPGPGPATGTEGGACFGDSSCDDPLVCNPANICEQPVTGEEGAPCYPNGSCNAELVCNLDDICEFSDDVGEDGGPCYANDTCNEGLVCNALDRCEPDLAEGVEGGPCREAAPLCDPGLACEEGRCDDAPPPVISRFDADPPFTVSGETTTLEWDSEHSASCSVSGLDGVFDASDTVEVSPEVTTTYTLTCVNENGSAVATVAVNVRTPVQILSFAIGQGLTETTIDQGETLTLIWSSRFADGCSIDPLPDAIDTAGSLDVTPESTTVYTLICTGDDGPATAEVVINVNRPVAIASLTVNGDVQPSEVDIGTSLLIEWTATDAEECTLTLVGETIDESVSVAAVASVTRAALEDVTATLTCTGLEGPAVASVAIEVRPQVVILDWSPSDDTITTGSSVQLLYATENADSCEATSSLGEVVPQVDSANGVLLVTPSSTTTYTLVCQGSGGPVSQTFTVTTLDPARILSLTIDGDPASLTYLEPITIRWETEDVTDGCTLLTTSTPSNEFLEGDFFSLGSATFTVTLTPTGTPGGNVTFALACAGEGGPDTREIVLPMAEVLLIGNVTICRNADPNPANRDCGSTHTVAELANTTRITGALSIRSDLEDIAIPKLAEVDGPVEIFSYAEGSTIALPGMLYANDDLNLAFDNAFDPVVSGDAGDVVFERLIRVGRDFTVFGFSDNEGMFDVPRLAEVGRDLELELAPCTWSYSLPELRSVSEDMTLNYFSGPEAPDEAFQRLDTVGGAVTTSQHAYSSAAMQAWTSSFDFGSLSLGTQVSQCP